MKFEFNWPSGFKGEDVDGRTTDDGVTGILIAHLGAFGSGELTKQDATVTLGWQDSKGGDKHKILSVKF